MFSELKDETAGEAPVSSDPRSGGSARRWFERFPRLAMAAWLVVLLLALDITAGVVYGWVKGHSFFEWTARYRSTSELYSHDLRANVSDHLDNWGPIHYPVFTNSLGFRDGEVREIPLVTDQERILFMGDSFTEGVGVVYERTFVGIVDSVLGAQGIDVLNGGVSGYSPLIYWLKTRYWLIDRGLDVDHVIVYLDVTDVRNEASDFSRASDGSVLRVGHVRGHPRGDGRLGWLKDALKLNTIVLASIARWRAARAYASEEAPPPNTPQDEYYVSWAMDDSSFAEYGETGVLRMVQYMDSLRVLLRQQRIDMTVAVYPWPRQILVGDADARQVRIWRDWTARHGVRFVDHSPDFVTGGTQAERLRVVERYFIAGDVHWSAQGHSAVAEGLLRTLRTAGDTTSTQAAH